MENAFILGCSHSAGADVPNGLNKSYAASFARLFNFNPINLSITGGSNDAMFRIFSEYVALDKIKDTDIIIACWTGTTRTETVHNELWSPIVVGHQQSPIENYIKQWSIYDSDSTRWRLNKIKNIVALNELATRLGLRVINFDSFHKIPNSLAYDSTVYNWPCAQDSFVDWCVERQFEHSETFHFYENAHWEYANYAYDLWQKQTS